MSRLILVSRLREMLALGWPTLLVVAACLGLAAANWVQPPAFGLALIVATAALGAARCGERARLVVLGLSLAALGLWWGSLRVEALERSVLVGRVGDIEPAESSCRARRP